jgi:hypothetical protein
MRAAALAPSSEATGGFVSSLLGRAFAAVAVAPEGPVAGDGVEETLARTAYHLEAGRLEQAVAEMRSNINGIPAVLAADWLALAERRVEQETAARALRARSIVSHLSFHS